MIFATTIAAILAGLIILQIVYALAFYWFLRGSMTRRPESGIRAEVQSDESFQPKVAIVICLRGADPSLVECLTGISLQEYPNAETHVVVDNENDASLDLVRDFYDDGAADKMPQIHVIEDLGKHCSLKCSALATAYGNISEEVEVFAFIDADAAPDQNWLSDLVAPLADEQIGATTGNRWFAPVLPSVGSYVRQLWNAAAVVQMDIYNIGWGGTLAIKRSSIEKCKLADKWRSSFCEDTMLNRMLAEENLKLKRVPSLILENSESTSLTDAFNWIVRQLLTVRLYHPRWHLVRMHGITTGIANIIVPLAIVIFYFLNASPPFYLLLTAFIAYQFCNLFVLALVDYCHQRVLKAREGFNRQPRPPIASLKLLAAYVLVQLLHPMTCIKADRLTEVRWRGIDYEVGRDSKIRLKQYRPYEEEASENSIS